jgi:hypothetical protein
MIDATSGTLGCLSPHIAEQSSLCERKLGSSLARVLRDPLAHGGRLKMPGGEPLKTGQLSPEKKSVLQTAPFNRAWRRIAEGRAALPISAGAW